MASFNENNIKSKADWVNALKRTTKAPLDRSSIFGSYDDAVLYASGGGDSRGLGGSSYIGQVITVYEDDKVDVYVIDSNKTLKGVGGDASPIGYGESEHSAVLKGGNNTVGLKGFYYKHLYFNNSLNVVNIYVTATQTLPTISTSGGATKETDIITSNYLEKGDIISIVNDNKYDRVAEVLQVNPGLIQVKWVDNEPFNKIKKEEQSEWSPEDYSIYCLDKPDAGIVDIGKYSVVRGTNNKAINVCTEAHGNGNIAEGKFATVWGKNNIGGYNTTTFGVNNVNRKDNSLVGGTNNINEASNSVMFGNKNTNYGKRAFIVGNQNITNTENEAAFGQFNKSDIDTRFSIGIGSSDDDRKNAFEVKQNGDIYIEGVEGRIQDKLNEMSEINKTIEDNEEVVAAALNELSENINNKCDNSRAEELQTLIINMQTYINALETRIVEIETVISQITVQNDN
jgi:hypothetical protein